MSEREVEVENTRMDAEQVNALFVITLGTVADEAQALAQKLSRRKRFKIYSQEEFCQAVASNLPPVLSERVRHFDASWTCLILLLEDAVALVFAQVHGNQTFYIVDSNGDTLQESDDLVRQVRLHPEFTSKPYLSASALPSPPDTDHRPEFERRNYLNACRAEFNQLRYAPLASIGLRFPNASIGDVYVPASAELTEREEESSVFRDALRDLLETLQLDDAQRAAVESQIRSNSSVFSSSNETGAARELYQQHGSVLILGDPGSGKTCFVKNEILSYCADNPLIESWYRLHTPLYVPLAEVVPLMVEEGKPFLEACVILVQRRGLAITLPHVHGLLRQGLLLRPGLNP